MRHGTSRSGSLGRVLVACGCLAAATCGRGKGEVGGDGGGAGPGADGSRVAGDASIMARPRIVSSDELPAEAAAGAEPAAGRKLEPGTIEVRLGRPGDGAANPAAPPREDVDRGLYLVLDTPYESWADEGTFVHLAAFTLDFKPAAGAEVYLNGRRIGTTDEHGSCSFRRTPVPDESMQEGILVVRLGGKQAGLPYRANSRTRSFEAPTVFVSTDRGVYNPGQTVLLRAIAWKLRGEYEAFPDQDVELALINAEGRIVGGGLLRTDRWGVGTLELPLPANAREGRYTLAATLGTERAQTWIRVERFVPPVIDIEHTLGRFLTPEQAELPFEVRLGYFGGGAFKSGHVTVTGRVRDAELFRLEQDVTGPGPHRFLVTGGDLRRIHDTAREGDVATIEIAVRDADGRSDTHKRELRYTRNPYMAVIELDRTQYAAGDPVQAMVRLVDVDGVPIRVREVTLEVSGRPPAVLRTDEGGVAKFTFPAPAAGGGGEIRARLADVAEPVATSWVNVRPPLPMRSAIAETVVAERAEVPVEIVFPSDIVPAEDVVHADIVDSSGALIHSFLVPVVRDGRTVKAVGSFRAPSWGSMLLTLFCLGRQGDDIGLMSDGQNVAVHPGRALTVTFHNVPQQAQPGRAVAIGVDVVRPDGSRRDTVLGAAVVDQAVLSMLDPLERSPVDRFYNPERKVLASTGAQTLTWPVVQRNWGDDRYDIGWPATFGWHSGHETRRQGRGEEGEMAAGAMPASPPVAEPSTVEQSVGSRSRQLDGGEAPAPQARLILRTNFAETSLWEPRLVARDGHAEIPIKLPDSITVQNLTVIASDEDGGIGMQRAEIPVRQPLYVRSDLPATLTEGDTLQVPVAVRNLSGVAQQATAELVSASLTVAGEPQTLAVEPDGTAVAWFTVTATRPGPASFTVSAETTTEVDGERIRDAEVRELFVRPSGEPQVTIERGRASADGSFATKVRIAEGDRWSVVRVGVTLPNVLPALPGLQSLIERGNWGADPAASRLLAACAAYAYLDKSNELFELDRADIRDALGGTAAAILMSQNEDGGWGWFWDLRSNPYISAYALHALIELRQLDFPVPATALRDATAYLLKSIGDDGLYDMAAIAVWEGNDPAARLSGTAEIFDVLSRVPGDARPDEWLPAVTRLGNRFEEYLDAAAPDPLVLAHAVGGLYRLRDTLGRAALEEKLKASAQQLARVRRETHWEPGWFQAYGGTVEAAAVALEVLQALAPDQLEDAKREALQVLLETRDAWGEWHNARSTAFAVRALLLIDPLPEGRAGTIAVKVDGVEKRVIVAGPEESSAAVLELRDMELEGLEPGEHTVEVTHDGTLAADVTLEVRRWTGAGAVPAGQGPSIAVERRAPEALDQGALGEVAITVRPPAGTGPLRVQQPLPAAVAPERSSLDALVADGTLAGWDFDGATLALDLGPGGDRTVAFRISAERVGTVTLPAALVVDVLRPEVRGRSGASILAVR